MGKIFSSVTELIGNTPLLEIKNYEEKLGLKTRILVKLEYLNPNNNQKDRMALNMIEDAEEKGMIKPGYTIVEFTSGNTGVSLAALCAAKGYKFRAYLQDAASDERIKLIKVYGGEAVRISEVPLLKEVFYGTNENLEATAKVIREDILGHEENTYFMYQGGNPSNPESYEKSMGPEIWKDTEGDLDILVVPVGTGGTISGAGRYLKARKSDIRIIGVQPGKNSVPSETNPSPETIIGIHPFVDIPEDAKRPTLDINVIDESFDVETAEAYSAARTLAKTEGILAGISSGASLHAATVLAQKTENAGKTIVTILPDTGLFYLSTNLFF